jgi:hypothetical protein
LTSVASPAAPSQAPSPPVTSAAPAASSPEAAEDFRLKFQAAKPAASSPPAAVSVAASAPAAPSAPAQPNVMVEAGKEMAAGLAAIGAFAAVTGGTMGWGAIAGIGAAAGAYAATKEALNTGQAALERSQNKNTATDSVLMMAGDALNTNKALGLGDRDVTWRRTGDRALTVLGDAAKGAASAGAMQAMRMATTAGVAHLSGQSATALKASPQLLAQTLHGLSWQQKLGIGIGSAAAGQTIGTTRALAETSFHVATSDLSSQDKTKALQQAMSREAATFAAGSSLFGLNTFIPPGMKQALIGNIGLGAVSNTIATAAGNAAAGLQLLTKQDLGIIAMSSVVDGAQFGLARGGGKAPLTDEDIYRELNENPHYTPPQGGEPPAPALAGASKGPNPNNNTGDVGGQEPPPVDTNTPSELSIQNGGGQNSDGDPMIWSC